MNSFAIIQLKGHQYPVVEGEEIITDHLDEKEGKKIKAEKVLLIEEKGEVKVGKPEVAGAEVTLQVIEHLKGKKIRVAKFRAKSRYRKVKGFRPSLTRLKVLKITSGQKGKKEE